MTSVRRIRAAYLQPTLPPASLDPAYYTTAIGPKDTLPIKPISYKTFPHGPGRIISRNTRWSYQTGFRCIWPTMLEHEANETGSVALSESRNNRRNLGRFPPETANMTCLD